MCVPVAAAAIAAAVISVAGDVTKSIAQDKAAKKNKAAALQAEIQEFAALDARGREEAIAAVHQKEDIGRTAAKDTGTLSAAAAQAGVGGSSVSAVLHQVDIDKARADTRITENLSIEQDQIEREKLGVDARTQDRINAVPRSNPFATGLSIIGDVAGAAARNPSAFGLKTG